MFELRPYHRQWGSWVVKCPFQGLLGWFWVGSNIIEPGCDLQVVREVGGWGERLIEGGVVISGTRGYGGNADAGWYLKWFLYYKHTHSRAGSIPSQPIHRMIPIMGNTIHNCSFLMLFWINHDTWTCWRNPLSEKSRAMRETKTNKLNYFST